MTHSSKKLKYVAWAAITAATLVGCQSGGGEVPAGTPQTPKPLKVIVDAPAGVPLTAEQDPTAFDKLVASRTFSIRSDPFALRPTEQQFEKNQEALKIFSESGFRTDYEAPEEKAEPGIEAQEQQPYRRLAGIVVGDSILALIDMGDGKGLQVVRPGQQIPDSEWRVVSIDSEKAVLRRNGSVRPRQITVPLESPPPGAGGAAGGFGGAGGAGGFGGRGGAPAGGAGGPGAGSAGD